MAMRGILRGHRELNFETVRFNKNGEQIRTAIRKKVKTLLGEIEESKAAIHKICSELEVTPEEVLSARNEEAVNAYEFKVSSSMSQRGVKAQALLQGVQNQLNELRSQRSAIQLAEWLSHRPEVARVLYPALPGAPGHQLWKRDCLGASGLFGFVLRSGGQVPSMVPYAAGTLISNLLLVLPLGLAQWKLIEDHDPI